MIKHFCDNCKDELNSDNKGSNLTSDKGIKVRLSVVSPPQIPEDEEEGEYCKYCLLDEINKLDDRPKQA